MYAKSIIHERGLRQACMQVAEQTQRAMGQRLP